jgi:Ca2+-binding EF-hand superfamily protein/thiol-disulfide isomerase/thioredoxin
LSALSVTSPARPTRLLGTGVVGPSPRRERARVRAQAKPGETLAPPRCASAANNAERGSPLNSQPSPSRPPKPTPKQQQQQQQQNKNSTIDRAELKRLLNTVDQGTAVLLAYDAFLTDGDVDAAFARYDADGSGALDFDEFQRLIEDGLLLSEPLSEYEQLFAAADTSGNGTLGAAELKKLLAAMGRGDVSDDRLVELFAEYDLDGSGQVELREFLRMCARRLVDVGALKEWMRSRPDGVGAGAAAGAAEGGDSSSSTAGARAVASLLEAEDGDVTVIFSAEELEEAIRDAQGGVVALMAGLTWCRPCKGVAGSYAKLVKKYGGGGGLAAGLKIYGNANDRTKAVFKKLKIRSTPAFVFFKDGAVIGATTGANKARLESAMREALGGEEALAAKGVKRLYPAPAGPAAGGGEQAAVFASSGSGSE